MSENHAQEPKGPDHSSETAILDRMLANETGHLGSAHWLAKVIDNEGTDQALDQAGIGRGKKAEIIEALAELTDDPNGSLGAVLELLEQNRYGEILHQPYVSPEDVRAFEQKQPSMSSIADDARLEEFVALATVFEAGRSHSAL